MKKLLLSPVLPLSLAFLLSLAPACSSDGADTPEGDGDVAGDGDAPSTQFPADVTAEGVAAFLETGSYKNWAGDPAIRGSDEPVNAHGDNLRVYVNEFGMQGNAETAPFQSMAVKELYNDAGDLVGLAASMKNGETEADWSYYCNEEEGNRLCTGQEISQYPVFGDGLSSCGICHSDGIFAPLP